MTGRLFYSHVVCRSRSILGGDSLTLTRQFYDTNTAFDRSLHGFYAEYTAKFTRGNHNTCHGGIHINYNRFLEKNHDNKTIDYRITQRVDQICGSNPPLDEPIHTSPPSDSTNASNTKSFQNVKKVWPYEWKRCLHNATWNTKNWTDIKNTYMSTPKNRHGTDTSNSRYIPLFNRNILALLSGATFALYRSSDGEPVGSTIESLNSDESLDSHEVAITFGDVSDGPEDLYIQHDDVFIDPFDVPLESNTSLFHEKSAFSLGNLWTMIYKGWENVKDAWKEAAKDGNVVSLEPLWVILGNTSPTTFGNAFMIVCGTIFTLWKLGDNMKSSELTAFMQKHFLASYDALKGKRFHVFLMSAISHTSLLHLAFNFMMFHQLINTFHRNMLLHRSKGVNSHLDDFINSIFSSLFSSVSSLTGGLSSLWGSPEDTQNPKKYGRVTTNDIFNVMVLSSIVSSFGHVYLYRTPVLGASGAISGLVYLLASTFPNSFFRTVFPLPGLHLSILQVCQLFVATNVYFLLSGGSKGIAWAAHLMGMGTGALYCWFQQNINRRPGFYNPITLSIKTARQQWSRTFKGIGKP